MNKDWIDSLKYYAQMALAFILGYSVLALFLVVMAFFVLAILGGSLGDLDSGLGGL